MAARKNNEELKQHALAILAEGRFEITGQMSKIREQLSPTHALHKMVRQHTFLVVLTAISAGLIPSLIIFQREQTKSLRPPIIKDVKPRARLAISPLLFGLLGKTITPTLIKTAFINPLVRYLHKKELI